MFTVNIDMSSTDNNFQKHEIYVARSIHTNEIKTVILPGFDVAGEGRAVLYISEQGDFSHSRFDYLKENYFIVRKVNTLTVS